MQLLFRIQLTPIFDQRWLQQNFREFFHSNGFFGVGSVCREQFKGWYLFSWWLFPFSILHVENEICPRENDWQPWESFIFLAFYPSDAYTVSFSKLIFSNSFIVSILLSYSWQQKANLQMQSGSPPKLSMCVFIHLSKTCKLTFHISVGKLS